MTTTRLVGRPSARPWGNDVTADELFNALFNGGLVVMLITIILSKSVPPRANGR